MCKYDCPNILIYIWDNYDINNINKDMALYHASSRGFLNMTHLMLLLYDFDKDVLYRTGQICSIQMTAIFSVHYPNLPLNLTLSELQDAKKRKHKIEVKLLMPRIFDICCCFRELSANEQLEIVNQSIKGALYVSDYIKWKIITTIKHFN